MLPLTASVFTPHFSSTTGLVDIHWQAPYFGSLLLLFILLNAFLPIFTYYNYTHLPRLFKYHVGNEAIAKGNPLS